MSEEFQKNRVGFLTEYLTILRKSFHKRDFSGLSVEQLEAVMSMPNRLDLIRKILRQIEADEVNIAKIVSDVEREEKQREIDERIAQVSHEMFVVACASNIPMEQILEVRKEVELDDKYLNDATKDGLNPLAAALAGGRSAKELDLLIKEGADVNFKTPDGNNAAHFAVMFGVSDKILEHLIKKHKVDINAKNEAGLTPLDMALIKQEEQGRESSLVKVLRDNGAKLGILAGLVKGSESDEEKAEALVGKKLQEVKERNSKRDAAKKGRSRIDERSADGELSRTEDSVVDAAELERKKGIAAQYLSSMNIDIDEQDDARTILNKALLVATRNNQPMMTLFLIQSGAVIDQEVAHAAIDTKNMNLICVVIANSTRDVMQVAEVYAGRVYEPAAVLIDVAVDRGFLNAYAVASPAAIVEHETKKSVAPEQSSEEKSKQDQEKEKSKLSETQTQQEEKRKQEEIQTKLEEQKVEAAKSSGPRLDLFETATLSTIAIEREEPIGAIFRDLFNAVEDAIFGESPEEKEEQEMQDEIVTTHEHHDEETISRFQEKAERIADFLRVTEDSVNHVLGFLREKCEKDSLHEDFHQLHDDILQIMGAMKEAGIGDLEDLENVSISVIHDRQQGGIKPSTPVASH